MSRLDEIKEKVEELIKSNELMITPHINEKEKAYYEEYGKNVKKLSDNFFKSFKEDNQEKALDEFFINNDSLKKKLAERRKLAVGNLLDDANVRAELNSSIDFYLSVENVLVNNVSTDGVQ